MATDPEFFATAAQVVPLLALAGFVEDRRGWDAAPSRSDPILRLVLVLGLMAAEVAALTALAGRPTPFERKFVILGLVIGGFALALRFLGHEIDALDQNIGNRWVKAVVVLAWLLAVMALLFVPIGAVVF